VEKIKKIFKTPGRLRRKIQISLLTLHFNVAKKSHHYRRWHKYKHHNKIHWAILGSHAGLVLVALALVFVQFFGNNSYAAGLDVKVDLREAWEQGTAVNIDTEDTPGTIKINSDGAWGPRTYQTPPDNLYRGASTVTVGNYQYTFKGNGDNSFYRYSIDNNKWASMEKTPLGVYAGAHLEAGPADTIYAIFGNYTKRFYKYTISTNTWTRLADPLDTTGPGSSIVYTGTNVYLLRGMNT